MKVGNMTVVQRGLRIAGIAIGYLAAPLFVMFSRKDRVRAMVFRKNGDVLLVRPYIGRQDWALPGGGVKRGESYEQAAVREVHEEAGIAINSELHYLGRILSYESFYPFPVRVYQAVATNESIQCNSEIIEAQWLSARELPGEYQSMLRMVSL